MTYHTHILMFNHCHNTRYQDKQVLYVSKTKLEITKRALVHHSAIN